MTDSENNSPVDADPTPTESAGTEYPDFIARSVMGVVRRTERALSPWVQRMMQTRRVGLIRRDPASTRSSGEAAEPPLPSTPLDLAERAASMGRAARRKSLEPRAAIAANRFASRIADRFPSISVKYESRPLAASAVQRAEMPVADGGASPVQSASAAPMFAESTLPEPTLDEMPPISIAPGDSVASHLAARLQAFRQIGPDAPIVQPSPREISRKAAAVAQRRISAERPKLRRAVVEELGAKPPAPIPAKAAEPKLTPSIEVPERTRRETSEPKTETRPRQRTRSAPPTQTPTRPAAPVESASTPQRPTLQRKPALPWDDGAPETIDAGPNPSKPSVFESLAQRLAENRFETHWDAPTTEPGEPPTPAPAPTRESRPLVQRKPTSPPSRSAVSPEPLPSTVQRSEAEPEPPAEELPFAPKGVRESPPTDEPVAESKLVESKVRPTPQRKIEEPMTPAPTQEPVRESRVAVPAEEATLPLVIRRMPESAPPPPSPRPTESKVEDSSERADDSERSGPRAQALSPQPAPLSPPPAIQREVEIDAPRVQPEVETSREPPSLGESIRARVQSAMSLPLTQTLLAIQRKPAEARVEPPALQTTETVSREPEPSGEVEAPACAA